jgi:hypothetical protein
MEKTNNVIIVLTSTIDIKGVVNTAIDEPLIRLEEYRTHLNKWLDSKSISKIIFCENSGFDLSTLKKEIAYSDNKHKIELLQFDGQYFDRNLGKSYGEMLTLEYISNNSKWFDEADLLLKVNGRYFVRNIDILIKQLMILSEPEVVGDFHSNLESIDSRVFAFTPSFFREYFLTMKSQINESGGIAFEWALARAAHKAISDGKIWEMLPVTPIIEGYSGSTGHKYSTNKFKWHIKQLMRALTKYLLNY